MSQEKRQLFQMPIVEKTLISFNIIIAISLFKSYCSRKKLVLIFCIYDALLYIQCPQISCYIDVETFHCLFL